MRSTLNLIGKTIAAAAIIVTAAAVPAFAGSRDSSFAGWHPFSDSSKWNDSGDSDGTSLKIKQCTYSFNSPEGRWITFQLRRNDTFTPDEAYENRGVDCWATSDYHWGSWGNKGSGEFYWRIRYICGLDSPVEASTKSVIWYW